MTLRKPAERDQPVLMGMSDDHLRALGALVATFSQTEFLLLVAVANLTPFPDAAAARLHLGDLRFPQLVDRFAAVVALRLMDEPVRDQAATWIQSARATYKQRNEVVQSWVLGRSDHQLVALTPRRHEHAELPRWNVSVDDLVSLVSDIVDLRSDLLALWPSLGLEAPSI
jgi:hypothetical protein